MTRARAGAGTRGAQAAARFSVLVVFLLLELGHQAEFTASAALGKIQHHVLWRRREMERVRPPFTQAASPSAADGRGAAKRPVLVLLLDFQSWTDRSFLMPFKSRFAEISIHFHILGFIFSFYNVYSSCD